MKPHPTHYYGRPVERVNIPKSKKDPGWEIEFEGGVVFKNQAEGYDPPGEEIVGHSLLTVVDKPDEEECVLRFGYAVPNGPPVFVGDAVVKTGEWTISDPHNAIEPGEHVQGLVEAPSADSDTPPDPSHLRVADGPSEAVEGDEETEPE